MQPFLKKKRLSVFQNFFYSILVIYFIEIIFGGPGSWSMHYLNVNLRFTFFVLVIISMLVNVLIKSRTLRMLDFSIFIIGILSFIFWIFILPMIYGIRQSYSIEDGRPIFSMFVLTWLFVINIIKRKREDIDLYKKICEFVFILSIISAVMHLTIYALHIFFSDIIYEAPNIINNIFDSKSTGGIFVGLMPDGCYRVFWISSIFMIYGLYRSIVKVFDTINIHSIVLLLIFLMAFFVTQTRSFLLAIPIALIFSFAMQYFVRKRLFSLNTLLIIFIVCLIMVTFFLIIFALPDYIKFLGLSRDSSDSIRYEQIPSLLDSWFKNIFIGRGFGAEASLISSSIAPFSYEMSILALYMKVGILGIFFISLYFFYVMKSLIPSPDLIVNKKKDFTLLFSLIFCSIFIFNTNPYFFNSVGIGFTLLCCIETARISFVDPI
jgi:hypothetical protein